MASKTLINKRLLIFIIAAFAIIDCYSQENNRLKILLDSMTLDYNLTPNKVIKSGKIENDIIWAGKIDSMEFVKRDNAIELFFYCNHRYFDNISKDNILSKNVFLKKEGDGYFVLSIISNNMTEETAKKAIWTFSQRSTTYILTIGKSLYVEPKFSKNYIVTMTYFFYTFK
jgi:hypothetical protein